MGTWFGCFQGKKDVLALLLFNHEFVLEVICIESVQVIPNDTGLNFDVKVIHVVEHLVIDN